VPCQKNFFEKTRNFSVSVEPVASLKIEEGRAFLIAIKKSLSEKGNE
jgi:hypothetical protein